MVKTENKKGKKKKKVGPGLRFRDFADNIQVINLEQIAEFKSGGTPSKENDKFWDGDIPWISAVSMRGKYYSKSERTITLEGLKNGSKLSLKGSILILVRGSMLYNKIPVGITSKDVAFNQDLKSITLNDLSNSEFLYQWFSAKQHFLLSKVVGTGIGAGKLDMDDIKKLKINLPSLPEQKKIATFLSAIDKKIQQVSRKKALLEEYKKGVMQQIFSQEIRFKKEDGGAFEKWEEKRLGEFLIPTIREVNKPKSNYLAIGIRSHCKGTFQKPNFDPNKVMMEKLFEVKENDLIVNITFAWEGAIAKVKKEDEGGLVSHRFPTYTFNREIAIHEYFQFVFIQKIFRFQLDVISPGGAGRNRVMSKKEFLKLKWEMPSVPEQKKIANFLITLDQRIKKVSDQITQMENFKKGLLQQMFV